MATQANTISPTDSQPFGVTAIARMVRGAPAVVYRITVPDTTGSNVVELRRAALENLIASAIDAIDVADGDPDVETGNAEDEALTADALQFYSDRPGCAIADPEEEDDAREEDDPQGDTTEDDPAFDAFSRTLANLKGLGGGPGCIISDDDCDRCY